MDRTSDVISGSRSPFLLVQNEKEVRVRAREKKSNTAKIPTATIPTEDSELVVSASGLTGEAELVDMRVIV